MRDTVAFFNAEDYSLRTEFEPAFDLNDDMTLPPPECMVYTPSQLADHGAGHGAESA
jgi:hypothetical protein